MRAVPIFWGVAMVVIALFLLQTLRRVSAGSSNQVVQGVNDGLDYILG